MPILNGLLADETGATGIEYAFLASLIAVTLVGAFEDLGNEIRTTFGEVESEYVTATGQ